VKRCFGTVAALSIVIGLCAGIALLPGAEGKNVHAQGLTSVAPTTQSKSAARADVVVAPAMTTTPTATPAPEKQHISIAVVTDPPVARPVHLQMNPAGHDYPSPHCGTFQVVKVGTIVDGGTTIDQVGDIIQYVVTITNTGDAPLTILKISDSLTPLQFPALPYQLAPGANLKATSQYSATLQDLKTSSAICNTVLVTTLESGSQIAQTCVPVAPRSALRMTKTVKSVKNPNNSDGGNKVDQVKDEITYEITVTNDGPHFVSNVTVDDSLTGAKAKLCCPSLAPHASCTITETYQVTQEDLRKNGNPTVGCGYIANTATAHCNEGATATAQAQVFIDQCPLLSITKRMLTIQDAAGNDLGTCAKQCGDKITYEIVVTNLGPREQTQVRVRDDLTGLNELANSNGALASMGNYRKVITYVVTEQDIQNTGVNPAGTGFITNTASATSYQVPQPVIATVQTCLAKQHSICIDKRLVRIENGDGTPGGSYVDEPGDKIIYRIVVTNTGHGALNEVKVTDARLGLNDAVCGTGTLQPGASCDFDRFYVATDADLENSGDPAGSGYILNTASVECKELPPSTDSVKAPVQPLCAVAIDKQEVIITNPADNTPSGTAVNEAGDVIEYKVTVRNTGRKTLTGVYLTDNLIGGPKLSCGTNGTLTAGATCSVTYKYAVTAADIAQFGVNPPNLGFIYNTATVHSNEAPEWGDTVKVPVKAEYLLGIDKQYCTIVNHDGSPGGDVADEANDRITYNIVVTNRGQRVLTNVVVTDTLFPGQTVKCESGTLNPGQSCSVPITYFVPQSVLDQNGIPQPNGFITNIATVSADGAAPRSDTVKIPISRCPRISVRKCVDKITHGANSLGSEVEEAGDEIHYKIVAVNHGNVTLHNVTVDDTLLGPWSVGAPIPPGSHVKLDGFVAVYTVTAADIKAGGIPAGSCGITNTVTVESKPENLKVSDSVTVKIQKACECEDCCQYVTEEYADKKKRKQQFGYMVYEVAEQTVPYCEIKCEGGKCHEIVGTRTIKQFVERYKSEWRDVEEVDIKTRKVKKCLKCGIGLDECDDVSAILATGPGYDKWMLDVDAASNKFNPKGWIVADVRLSNDPNLSAPQPLWNVSSAHSGGKEQIQAIHISRGAHKNWYLDIEAVSGVPVLVLVMPELGKTPNPIKWRVAADGSTIRLHEGAFKDWSLGIDASGRVQLVKPGDNTAVTQWKLRELEIAKSE